MGSKMKPDEILHQWGDFFEQRNSEYGDAYLRFGEIASLMFPDGITIKGSNDFAKIHIFLVVLMKVLRIANARGQGEEHPDSWKDIAVYSAMYKEIIE